MSLESRQGRIRYGALWFVLSLAFALLGAVAPSDGACNAAAGRVTNRA